MADTWLFMEGTKTLQMHQSAGLHIAVGPWHGTEPHNGLDRWMTRGEHMKLTALLTHISLFMPRTFWKRKKFAATRCTSRDILITVTRLYSQLKTQPAPQQGKINRNWQKTVTNCKKSSAKIPKFSNKTFLHNAQVLTAALPTAILKYISYTRMRSHLHLEI